MTPRIPAVKKIALLNFIKEKKAVLFGNFSSDLENRNKLETWNDVLLKAKSLEIRSNERKFDFVRDKVFGVWKSRALKKRDNKRKTGTGGGKENVLDDVDHLILQIIGTESVVIDGLPIGESGEPELNVEDAHHEDVLESTPNSDGPSSRLPKRPHRSKAKLSADEEELKRKKLQTTLMEVTIYKTRLEAYQLEKTLSLPLSEYTKVLFDE